MIIYGGREANGSHIKDEETLLDMYCPQRTSKIPEARHTNNDKAYKGKEGTLTSMK